MVRRHAVIGVASVAFAGLAVFTANLRAEAKRMMMDEDFFFQPTFQLEGPALGRGDKPPADTPAHLAGATIAAVPGGAIVIDGDSGRLVRVDAKGKVIAKLAIARDAAQVVFDATASRAYVSDRRGDRIVVVDVGDKLEQVAAWTTTAEPWGLALSPDRATLLVTTIADRTLLAFDTATGERRWEHPLSREPRGVAFAADGKSATVAYLATGTVERVLTGGDHAGRHVALAGRTSRVASAGVQPMTGFVTESQPTRAFARNAFAVQTIGNGLTVVAFQTSTPVQIAGGRENAGSYGGGFEPPIQHKVAFLEGAGAETSSVLAGIISHQPNALGWDPATDRLLIAGYGSDDLLVVKDASKPTIVLERQVQLDGARGCGPDGIAVSGDTAMVWCSLSRKVVAVTLSSGAIATGPEATASRRSELERAGLALFRAGNDGRVSTRGAMACASCHPDGRDDGLSWRIEGHELQTPLLAGRVAGTHPYKWDGGDKDLTTSLTSTMRRLGGTGLGAEEVKALAAYLESIPAPRAPSRDRAQVARGKKLFAGELGCDTCHDGKKLTDRTTHELGTALGKVDTPSLIGLAASAPYYHDGSAATLEALLRDTALVHGMADLRDLGDAEIADLVAYLETL